jgi:hypothetical protein
MCDDIDAELTLLVLDEIDVGVDTFGLIPLRQFSCDRWNEIPAQSNSGMKPTKDCRVGVNSADRNRLEDKSEYSQSATLVRTRKNPYFAQYPPFLGEIVNERFQILFWGHTMSLESGRPRCVP